MALAVDTNVLARFIVGDDAQQEAAAQKVFASPQVFIPTVVFCELVWVMRATYKLPDAVIASAIRGVLNMENVEVRAAEVQAGLEMLDAGGDFADGVIAHLGGEMGAEAFVSFDRKAVRLLSARGIAASVPQ